MHLLHLTIDLLLMLVNKNTVVRFVHGSSQSI